MDGWQSAVAEGEDYELLVILNEEEAKRAEEDPLLAKTGFQTIGHIQAKLGLFWRQQGELCALKGKGWEVRWS